MAAFNLNQEPPPECFGVSWNAKDVLCAGGADLTFRDERTGSHVRPPCDFFQACGTRVAHAKMEQSRLIPASNLVRSPTPQQPVPAAAQAPAQMTPAQMQQWLNDQAKALATQMLQQMQQYPQGRSPAAPYNTTTYPQGGMFFDTRFQPMPVNYQMPSYLTVPEGHGGSLFGMLLRTLFRSMGKAAGHSFSHFWDTVPLGGMPPGGGQGG